MRFMQMSLSLIWGAWHMLSAVRSSKRAHFTNSLLTSSLN
jgi:hypothetical protein